jgi:cytochrome c556
MRSLVKPHLVRLTLVVLGALVTLQAVEAQDSASAPPATPEEAMQKAVETRQALFKVINFNSEQVMGMLKKVPFDGATLQKVGGRIEVLAPMIPELFAADTRKATNVKTKAREGIWTNAADFKAKADELAKAAQALSVAGKGGDKAEMRKAIVGVGKACSGCHDNYRDKL